MTTGKPFIRHCSTETVNNNEKAREREGEEEEGRQLKFGVVFVFILLIGVLLEKDQVLDLLSGGDSRDVTFGNYIVVGVSW